MKDIEEMTEDEQWDWLLEQEVYINDDLIVYQMINKQMEEEDAGQ